jgi:hypothetical protein
MARKTGSMASERWADLPLPRSVLGQLPREELSSCEGGQATRAGLDRKEALNARRR